MGPLGGNKSAPSTYRMEMSNTWAASTFVIVGRKTLKFLGERSIGSISRYNSELGSHQ
jgi:hypothetical protein